MNISEQKLREAIIRAIARIEAEEGLFLLGRKRQKIYMVCTGGFDGRYLKFLRSLEETETVTAVPVLTEELRGQEECFAKAAGRECLYLDREVPEDLERSVTVFPVVPRDLISKTALCISDTPQTRWITSCMEAGSRIVFLTSGLSAFTGREPKAYVNRILSYCRTVLEYGIEITKVFAPQEPEESGWLKEQEIRESRGRKNMGTGGVSVSCRTGTLPGINALGGFRCPDFFADGSSGKKAGKTGKKRVISSKDVEQLQRGGILIVGEDDIITDLAKDRAKFLNVTFKTADEG